MLKRIANTKEDGHALQKRASGSFFFHRGSLSSCSAAIFYLSATCAELVEVSGLVSLPDNKVSYYHLDVYFY
ncbi:MAG: hypothetical protein ACI9OS_000536 [Ulvibacter sp.]|jgi:hypothetical protein